MIKDPKFVLLPWCRGSRSDRLIAWRRQRYMQAMEKLTDAKSKAIKTVLPTLEAFYATLSTGQKAILDSKEGRSRFWRWHDPA